jgi:hypothetical protein
MGDWIDSLGDDEEQRRKSEARHAQLQSRRFDVIRQNKKALWASLMNVINRDVEKFQTKFKGRRSAEFTSVSELEFRLYKTPYPTVLMDAGIPPDGTSIEVTYIRTFNLSSPMEKSVESFELTIDGSDNLVIAHNGRRFKNLDQVSRFLLEPVFTAD